MGTSARPLIIDSPEPASAGIGPLATCRSVASDRAAAICGSTPLFASRGASCRPSDATDGARGGEAFADQAVRSDAVDSGRACGTSRGPAVMNAVCEPPREVAESAFIIAQCKRDARQLERRVATKQCRLLRERL